MTRMPKPLHVIVMGADRRLNKMLRQNLQQWGWSVRLLEPEGGAAQTVISPAESDASADVLLVDLDGLEVGDHEGEEEDEPGLPSRPSARLTVALGSQQPRRAALEMLGAVFFLAKPFDMSILRGYLMTLERIFAGEPEPTSVRPDEAHKLRVLVADDDSRVTTMACALLSTQERFAARAAHDGLEVLEACLTWQPHCLVIDVMMPRMNGYQVLRCLQARPGASPLPVVVLSALAGVEVRAEEMAQPMVALLDKPVRPAHLLAAVERALALGVK